MNGEPLPIEHGYPLRLIVPSWYAVASVKWLTEIELTDRPFDGFFQTDKYCYETDGATGEPVTLQQVRSLITDPGAGEELPRGRDRRPRRRLVGCGADRARRGPHRRRPWQQARLVGERQRHSWQWWELLTRLDQPGANPSGPGPPTSPAAPSPSSPSGTASATATTPSRMLVQVTP